MQSDRQAADDAARLAAFGSDEARREMVETINKNIQNAIKA